MEPCRRSPEPSASRVGVGVLAGLVVLAACSGAEPEAPEATLPEPVLRGGFERLSLVGAAGLSPLPVAEAEAVARFEPGREPEAWTVQPGPATARTVPGHPESTTPALLVAELREGAFRRELEFDSQRFEDVEVLLWVEREKIEVSVSYHLGSRLVGRSGRVLVKRSNLPQRVILPPGPQPEAFRFDSFALRFSQGGGGGVAILAVDLLEPRPPSAHLPAEQPRPELVSEGHERRRCWWLGTARPLEAEFEPRPGSELHFTYLRPPRTLRAGGSAALLVLVDGPQGQRLLTERLALESDLEEPATWKSARLPLPPTPLAAARVHFSIEAEGSRDAVCLLSEVGVWTPPADPPPSVLLITTDTHRGDHLGAAQSGVEVRTTALDALAARGVLFADCFSPANSTNPSHASLMTGTHPRDTGILDNTTALDEAAPTLAEAFRDAGYLTWAAVSVGHLQPDFSGLGQGFDRVSAPISGARDSSETIVDLLRWLPDAGQQPLFVWLHVFDAHTPYAPPEAYRRLYYPEGKDPTDPSIELPDAAIELTPALRDVRDMDYVRAQYMAEIDYLDDQLAPVLALPRFADGVTAVVGDHGEGLGEKGIYFRHEGLYPATLHVPLILAWPAAPAGTRIERPVTHVGLGRTLLDLAGLEELEFPGRSLWSPAGDAQGSEPRFFLGVAGNDAAIQHGDELLILHLRRHNVPRGGTDRARHSLELYDLARDPDCAEDLALAEPERTRRLHGALHGWLADQASGWAGAASVAPEFLAQLADLGYTERAEEDAPLLTEDDDCSWCRLVR